MRDFNSSKAGVGKQKTVLLPKPRGFCAGVIRAIDIVRIALERLGRPVYVRKEIVHNQFVVEQLAAEGAVFVEGLDEVPHGAVTIFSAHGVAPQIRAASARRKLRAIDATCPLVTKVHKEALRYAKEGRTIILIGHEGHDEVVGTMGEAPHHMTRSSEHSVKRPIRFTWFPISKTSTLWRTCNQTASSMRLKQR